MTARCSCFRCRLLAMIEAEATSPERGPAVAETMARTFAEIMAMMPPEAASSLMLRMTIQSLVFRAAAETAGVPTINSPAEGHA